ncbi:MAG: hypothetical protein AAF862_02245 [Pseudomonadota bacterium]
MTRHTFLALGQGLAASLVISSAAAQSVSINYDRLSSLEEPLAAALGKVTVTATGVLDAPLGIDLMSGSEQDVNAGFLGNIELAASTQLRNRWNVQVRYFAQYDSDPGASILGLGGGAAPDEYSDNVVGVISGAWGSVIGGNTANLVREQTRRLRGAGNGALAFDQTYGQLSDWGGAYVGQFGPARLSAGVDEDGNFDIGASWSRPLGNKDYRFTLRYTNADYVSGDGLAAFDTSSILALGEFTYGSGVYDVGVGYEDLSSAATDLERWYISSGARYKIGALTASLEGHYGRVGDEPEVSAALGVQYDIARGLSLNVGINHADAQLIQNSVTVIDRKATEALFSLRYSY